MQLNLKNKVVAITGGKKGIGKAIALGFANEGANLALSSRDRAGLKKTADEIKEKTGVEVLVIPGDLTKVKDQKYFISETIAHYGTIDVLINNAGSAHVGELLSIDDEEWEHHFDLKLLGYIRLTREVLPHMIKNKSGVILNIVGGYGKEPDGYAVLPGVINAGLLNFTRAVATRYAADNIRIISINPAVTETDLMEEMTGEIARSMGISKSKIKEHMLKSFPLKRIGKPEDVANIAVFLASGAASFITGTSIYVDGGISSGI